MKPPLSIKITGVIFILMALSSITSVLGSANSGSLLDALGAVFSILVNVFVAYGVFKLKRWGFLLGIVSLMAGIANISITLPQIVALSSQQLLQPLPEGYYIFLFVSLLPITICIVFALVALIVKRKHFIN